MNKLFDMLIGTFLYFCISVVLLGIIIGPKIGSSLSSITLSVICSICIILCGFFQFNTKRIKKSVVKNWVSYDYLLTDFDMVSIINFKDCETITISTKEFGQLKFIAKRIPEVENGLAFKNGMCYIDKKSQNPVLIKHEDNLYVKDDDFPPFFFSSSIANTLVMNLLLGIMVGSSNVFFIAIICLVCILLYPIVFVVFKANLVNLYLRELMVDYFFRDN